MSSADLFARAQQVIPGGVNSPVRSFRSVGGTPYFVERAEGPYVYDADGRRYIDYVQSYGPGILGHAHPKVVEAVTNAAAAGTTYGAPPAAEVVRALDDAGVPVTHLELDAPSLDDVFADATGRRLEGAEE